MRVVVDPYNPGWATNFHGIQCELAKALAHVPYISIEHVGSTSVPGLAAKPIIDIDIIVRQENVSAAITACKSVGYEYFGEWGIPNRHALRASSQVPERNLYVCVDGCLASRNHLAVRDTLRKDEKLRQEYAAVKIKLAEQEWNKMDEYCEGKNEILGKILKRAGFSSHEIDKVEEVNKKASRSYVYPFGGIWLIL